MMIHLADVERLDRRATELRTFYPGGHERFTRRLWQVALAGEVVGVALTGPPLDNLGPWVGQLHRLEVQAAHRGKGIGATLHEQCLQGWRAAGITVAVLELPTDNKEAQSFYESHGWQTDGHTREGLHKKYQRLRRTVN
jgi:ribosomal protein S18 acetylase RimI-like enzyme